MKLIRILISISINKGRFGNNIFHLLNLLASSSENILVLDSSYRLPFKYAIPSGCDKIVIFVPLIDKITFLSQRLILKLTSIARVNNIQLNQLCSFNHSCNLLPFLRLNIFSGELLSRNFSPAKFLKFERFLLQPLHDSAISIKPYACHIRLGDFKTYENGFFAFKSCELNDALELSLLVSGHSEENYLEYVYTDDYQQLEKLCSSNLQIETKTTECSYLDDWTNIRSSKIVITNASTFAISSFLLSSCSWILVIPARIYDQYILQNDPLFTWLIAVRRYNSLIMLTKPSALISSTYYISQFLPSHDYSE